MGIAQNQGPPVKYPPKIPNYATMPGLNIQPQQAPQLAAPPSPNGIPSPGAAAPGAPAAAGAQGAQVIGQGGAPGVYNYGITGSPNFSGQMDIGGVSNQMAGLNAQFNQLPLTPGMALGQSGLLAQYQNALSGAQAGYANAAAQGNLQFGRVATDQQRANEGLGSSMASRGILEPGNGVAASSYINQATDFNRTRQDISLATQDQMAQYLRDIGAAAGAYGLGLSGLALQSAAISSADDAYGNGAR